MRALGPAQRFEEKLGFQSSRNLRGKTVAGSKHCPDGPPGGGAPGQDMDATFQSTCPSIGSPFTGSKLHCSLKVLCRIVS